MRSSAFALLRQPLRRPAPLPLAASRSFSLSRPSLVQPPAREHSPTEDDIRAKLVDRLEADECDVEDTSGAFSSPPSFPASACGVSG